MFQKTLIAIFALVLTSSCVSKKVFNELEGKLAEQKIENRRLVDENAQLLTEKTQLDSDLKALQAAFDQMKSEKDKLESDYKSASAKLKNLEQSYAALEKNSDDALQANMKKNRELLAQLEAKEKALAAEQARLNKLQADLQDRSKRIDELERMIANKEAGMNKLRETLSKALYNFEGKGLTVEQKNGKVYVSMENKLLFGSGSWAVGTEGRKAVVEVGKVLADNPEISVLIEGHTDNVPYNGSGQIVNNWDLSTKRATAIVNILAENSGINKQNLTAAGRGEFAPLASNDTADGKAKNRRIEIILTPQLDEISKMLNEVE
uniref:OmpA family protein n=1 Tax=Flavobacterium sp. TaxID=239 RepID=UPI004049079E